MSRNEEEQMLLDSVSKAIMKQHFIEEINEDLSEEEDHFADNDYDIKSMRTPKEKESAMISAIEEFKQRSKYDGLEHFEEIERYFYTFKKLHKLDSYDKWTA